MVYKVVISVTMVLAGVADDEIAATSELLATAGTVMVDLNVDVAIETVVKVLVATTLPDV